MALKMKAATSRRQRGMSLIELMIAVTVLTIGVAGCAIVIPIAIGRNFANRQQGNSTAIAQMVLEKLLSVPASTSPTLTITDCAGNANLVSTTGTAGGSGSTVLSSGSIDFTAAQGSGGAPAGYYMNYTTCGTNGRQATYDVRWNIKAPSTFIELVTVSVKLKKTTGDAKLFAVPVTIRSMAGQGS
jgi:prepilin-type N-terminal cleavage/methylation domain-containing protein